MYIYANGIIYLLISNTHYLNYNSVPDFSLVTAEKNFFTP